MEGFLKQEHHLSPHSLVRGVAFPVAPGEETETKPERRSLSVTRFFGVSNLSVTLVPIRQGDVT